MSKVLIENISSDSKINLSSLKKLAQKILSDFKEKGDLNIILVADNFMRKLNQKFTRRNGTTDVLSFSFKEEGEKKIKKELLGEVYISIDRARKQAHEYQATPDQELKRLLAHGVLHLLGYEHKTKRDLEKMRKKEDECIVSDMVSKRRDRKR